MAKKPTNEDLEQRYSTVIDCLVLGYSAKDIFEKYAAKWGISLRTVYEYIKKGNKRLEADFAPLKKAEFEKSLRRLRKIVKRGLNTNDPKLINLALNAQKEINTMLDLYQLGKEIETSDDEKIVKIQIVKPIQRTPGDGLTFD